MVPWKMNLGSFEGVHLGAYGSSLGQSYQNN